MIIITVLQAEGKTWDFFLFWLGFQMKQEDQKKIVVRKLEQKKKIEDKEEVKPEGDSKPMKTKPQMSSACITGNT